MSRLEELTVGTNIQGLVNNESVQIVAVKWYGNSVLEITYKNNQGMLANQLVYAWPEIQSRASELKAAKLEQMTLFDSNEG